MIVAATGHRPNKIGGFKTPNPLFDWIYSETKRILCELSPEKAISGMALGFDTIFADVALELGIPLIAAVPFNGQENVWPKSSQDKYNAILKRASHIEIVSPGSYSVEKMQVRNCWMADRADVILACFNGSPGGTKNCIDYATAQDKKIIRINPSNFTPNIPA